MYQRLLTLCFCLYAASLLAQPAPTPLTIDAIMQDPKLSVGTSPSGIFWAEDGKTIYFDWNPERAKGDSLYKITLTGDRKPVKVSLAERRMLPPAEAGTYNRAYTLRLYEKYGDLFLLDLKTGKVRMLTSTTERETNPAFSADEQNVFFVRGNNVFRMSLPTGEVTQLINIEAGNRKAADKLSDEETVLKREQLALFDVLRDRKAKREEAERSTKTEPILRLKPVYAEGRTVVNPTPSPDGRFVTFGLRKAPTGAKTTIVPSYVTETGYTEPITGRTKVGEPLPSTELYVYDTQADTALVVSTKDIPGISDLPDYVKDYPKKDQKDTAKTKKPNLRAVTISSPTWSEDGKNAVVVVRAIDNKDRWIMQLDLTTRKLKLLDRQRDEAWVAGPGISGRGTLGWVDNQTLYFQSEASGYSHLYTVNVLTGEKKQLTSGKFEVQQVQLSRNKKYFYLTTNEVHPGEQHLYRMAVTGGERQKLTAMVGANEVTLSPDETKFAIRYSASTKPWELYLQELIVDKKGSVNATSPALRLTNSTTDAFNAYAWREPELVTIPARDGQLIYARLYKPKSGATGKAVVFVHGAGYLQNAHKWWSQYYHEYMFNNLLCDKGYTVLDIDYRGSAGYGRDWRTGIYRHMGGKDLTDHVDAAQWLAKNHGVDAKRIGIYGGSYGGFITLMAMFTTPDAFRAGAALRPVTDWAAYNHGYTANILNEPQTDSIAYHRSSPIFFADGLKGHLLICHGMVDVNVHFQDAVRLTQRLIELKKDNWEIAPYPVEDHGFVEPTSWLDEYKRILKLFDERL